MDIKAREVIESKSGNLAGYRVRQNITIDLIALDDQDQIESPTPPPRVHSITMPMAWVARPQYKLLSFVIMLI
jgi:hypothetical protein